MSLRPSFLARLATPVHPYMDGIHLDYQFFAIPLRLVWDNFTKMMGERTDPDDHNDYTIPQMVAPATVGHGVGKIADYLTIPTGVPDFTHSCLFHRAYYLCWNTWFRDENLQDSLIIPMDDGPDLESEYEIQKRGKRKDYLTGSLPFSQKGDPVQMPIGSTAPVVGTTDGVPTFQHLVGGENEPMYISNTDDVRLDNLNNTDELRWDSPELEVDLSSATSATINEMRQAIAIQHLLERDARGGSRYVEHNLVHFGVRVPDLRLFRPELLASGSMPLDPSTVPSTTDGVGEGLGELGAYAVNSQVGRGFVKTFDEHMIIMGFISCRAELTYQQGLNRMFSRKTRYEFFYPDLAHIGEQAVLSREIYVDGTGDEALQTGDFSVWGYQPRYEEYRHRTSVISGQFRSEFAQSLDVWHLALDFATRPVLNDAFIVEDPPIARIVIDGLAPELLVDSYYKIKHVRPMPKFGTPGLLRF